jgi:hypothetical protein
MPIVINGSGTITGVSTGGLPDGIVDAGTLATNSVDSAELIDGAVDVSHLASGDNTPSFFAQAATGQSIANATHVVGAFATEHWDTDNAWDNSSGASGNKFTVPSGKGGGYHFTVNGYMANIDDGENFRMSLAKNGSEVVTTQTKWFSSASNQEMMENRSWNIKLVAGDYIQVFVYHTEGSTQTFDYRFATFSGFKIIGP